MTYIQIKIHTGAVYGYRKSDGTLLEFPCTLDVSKAVKDDKGRWTASGLGFKPAVVKYSDSLKRQGVKKAWIGDGFAESKKAKWSPTNNTIDEVRFLNDVTSIGDKAFKFYNGLLGITIPNSVSEIGNETFFGCANLNEITIPALVVCYHKVPHRCQSKTLSPPDFESTYTNKASLEALAVC